MGPKKRSASDSREKKKRKVLSMETKREIIDKYERGVKLNDIAREYGRNPSTIGTILKQKEVIKAAKPSMGTTVMSKRRTPIHDKMERLLLVWIKDKERTGDTLTETIICEKASSIYNDLVSKAASDEQPTASTSSLQGIAWVV